MSTNITIDGKNIIGRPGQSIVQVARENGIDIPTLCHDERVKAYGSCGICVVEAENNPRLLRACATNIAEGMVITTKSPRIAESRRFTLELLLSDHQGDCRPPCMLACPGKTDCQGYVGLIANGKYKEASAMVKDVIPLPASIGRICPHPCEDACRRELVEEPISIAALKSVVGDYDLANGEVYIPPMDADTNKSVVVIGGGPGGLTAAYQLRRRGHRVKVLDAMPKMGGMLRYGIPEYRLPKALLDQEISLFTKMGIELLNNIRVGKDVTLEALRKENDAVVVAIGAWKSTGMSCPGDDLDGVLGGIYFLGDVALTNAVNLGQKVAVVGGGNTAMDACRTALRMGVEEVYVVYRRTRAEMPAEEIEIKEAEEEGVIFKYLTNPLEIIGNTEGHVSGLRLQKMELGAPDASGRRSPVPVEGAEEMLKVDTVIMAIGQGTKLDGFEDLSVTRWKTIVADERTFVTNLDGVFAVGDATNNGASIAIEAIGEARDASEVIHEYLMTGVLPELHKPYYATDEKTSADFAEKAKAPREQMAHVDPMVRRKNFEVITDGLTLEQAKKEASRCLECGCADIYECKLLDYANQYHVNPGKYEGEKNDNPIDVSNPFFYRNMEKCILCGLCVRVCDEVMGRTALGFSGRGFDTVAEPAPSAKLPLLAPEAGTSIIDSDCISCGQCISLCPTGALGEWLLTEKAVPLEETETISTCAFCSVGCGVNLTASADMLLRSLPARQEEDSLLCVRGRFGMPESRNGERITEPLMRRGDELVACTYEEAYSYIAEKAEALKSENAIGIAVSDQYTNEELLVIKEFADGLGNDRIFSLGGMKSGLADVTGFDASTCTFEDLADTDVILMVAPDIMASHTIAGIKVKKAVERGAKLILISNQPSQADEWATLTLASSDLDVLRQMLGQLLVSKDIAYMPDLQAYASNAAPPCENVKKAVSMYANAESAVTIFDQNAISVSAAGILADLAVLSGHIGKDRNGIIQLKQNNNSQGLSSLGIGSDADGYTSKRKKNTLRGLMIFGEDVADADVSGLELLVVHESALTETAKKAHVVLPAPVIGEVSGTYLNTVGETRNVSAATRPAVKGTCKTVYELADVLGCAFVHRSEEELKKAAAAKIASRKAGEMRLVTPTEAPAFVDSRNTHSVYKRFTEKYRNE